MEPLSREVVANRLRHRVLEWNGGGHKTVLLLHGFLDIAWGWKRVAEPLAAAGMRVLAPDLRGHGDSDRIGPGGYYHFFDYVFDVADLIEALTDRPLVLIGHSMGGAIASYFAGAFPEAIERVAILEGFGMREESPEVVPARTAEWVRSVRKARARQPRVYPTLEAAAARLRELDPRCDPDFACFLAEQGTREVPGGRAFKHDPVHLTRGPLPFQLALVRPLWEAIRCPTLLVEASESELLAQVPGYEERYRHFRHARRVIITDAGHMLIRHQPERLVAELLAFITRP
jgi:pimeloyl-ACP methyl ester carboxylesterase